MGLRDSIADLTRLRAEYTPDEKKISAASRTIGWTTLGVAVLGVVTLWIWAKGVKGMVGNTPTIEALLGANLLLGLAAAAAGAVFGFIFGMPRTMTLADRLASAKAAKEGGISDKNTLVMGVNTNLERISDWLTTLLVGATLVQLGPIAEWVGGLGSKFFKAGVDIHQAIIPVVAVLFFSLSFLGIYLITRLYLTSALSLTGSAGSRGHDADNVQELENNLKKSLETENTEQIIAALKAVDDAKLSLDERKNPMLNLNMARALAKLFKKQAASGRAEPNSEMQAAINNALVDPKISDELRKDVASVTTGVQELDDETNAKLKVK
jgi:hypothetical protein